MATQVFQDIRQINPLTLTFRLSPAHVSYANTLRRAVITMVPVVAFRADIKEDGTTSDVIVEENNTAMSNEMLADRIGLLPVAVENPDSWNPEEYLFELKMSNDSAEKKDVFASDIEVRRRNLADPTQVPTPVPNTQFFPPNRVSDTTCLISVLKGKQANQKPQTIHLRAKATVGTGKEHARFIPVSQFSYKYTVDPNEETQKAVFVKWCESNKKVSRSDLEADAAKRERLWREFKTMEIDRCFLKDERGEPYSFEFTMEVVGEWMSARKIIEVALSKIIEKCNVYAALDGKMLPDTVRLMPVEARMSGRDIIFSKEDHTLGNLLQTYIEQNMMDAGQVSFVGYKVPHPLRDEMLLRVGIQPAPEDKETDIQDKVVKVIAEAARGCATLFRRWLDDWQGQGQGLGQGPPPAGAASGVSVAPSVAPSASRPATIRRKK